MNSIRFTSAALFCLFIFVTGFWLTRSGKPYSGVLLNVHKLIALAAVVLFVIVLYRTNRATPLSAIEWVAGVAAVLSFVGLFVTGALVSIDKPMPAIVARLHHILPYLAVLATVVTLYLLGRNS